MQLIINSKHEEIKETKLKKEELEDQHEDIEYLQNELLHAKT